MRPRTALALLAVAACRPPVTLVTGEGELRVTPSQLDFGEVARGAGATRTLTLQNTSPSPLSVHAATSWPFDATPEARVEGGATAALEVRFSPIAVGEAPGALDLAWNDTHLFIPLHGVGVSCPPVDACHVLQVHDGACVVVPAADGMGCDDACLSGATCQRGTCVGSARSCDDGDACTLDTCEPSSGCHHVPLTCDTRAQCMRATGICNPKTGCELAPVEDGALCGDTACAWADVCIDGTCQRKATPNADADCHYTDVVAGNDMTCALTRSGHVRCWGDLLWAFDHPVAQPLPPTTMAGFSNIVVIAADFDVCGIDSAGVIHCGHAAVEPGGGTVSSPASLSITNRGASMYEGFVVSTTGEGTTWAYGQPLAPFDGGPVSSALVDSWTWVLDGRDDLMMYQGWFVQELSHEVAGSQLLSFGEAGHPALAVVAPDGTVELGQNYSYGCGGKTCQTLWGLPLDALGGYRWDAGAVTFGGSDAVVDNSMGEYACAAQRGGTVICRHFTGFERRYQVPGEIVKLTQRGQWHVCALNDLGDLWCFGENDNGQLGDPPYHPDPQWLDAPVGSMTPGFTVTDGGLYGLGGPPWFIGLPPDLDDSDGGIEWKRPEYLCDVGGAQLAGGTPLLLEGDRLFRWNGSGLELLASGIARCGDFGAKGCAGESASQWACRGSNGQLAFYGGTCRDGGQPTDGCTLFDDGGVRCNWARVPLSGAATVISSLAPSPSGCALLATGDVQCWDLAGVAPQTIAGLGPGVRQLRGALNSGCALVGTNAVKCWGDNGFEVVGPPSPSTPAMSTRVFDEPVVQLTGAGLGRPLTGVCVQLQSGRTGCWGYNPQGELGPRLMRSQLPIQIVK